MSAFIVTRACMDRVVSAVIEDTSREPFGGIPKESPDAWSMIGRLLYDLNRCAVLARYPDDAEYAAIPAYQFQAPHTDRLWNLKAVHCLLYQCSEGDIPTRPAFQDLEAVANRLAYAIVCDLPAYERAGWDG